MNTTTHQPTAVRWGTRVETGTVNGHPCRMYAERPRAMGELLLDAIERTDGEFRCSFSLSGTVIRQLRDWAPDALDSFVALAATGVAVIAGCHANCVYSLPLPPSCSEKPTGVVAASLTPMSSAVRPAIAPPTPCRPGDTHSGCPVFTLTAKY